MEDEWLKVENQTVNVESPQNGDVKSEVGRQMWNSGRRRSPKEDDFVICSVGLREAEFRTAYLRFELPTT
jgi:hypothetical protein